MKKGSHLARYHRRRAWKVAAVAITGGALAYPLLTSAVLEALGQSQFPPAAAICAVTLAGIAATCDAIAIAYAVRHHRDPDRAYVTRERRLQAEAEQAGPDGQAPTEEQRWTVWNVHTQANRIVVPTVQTSSIHWIPRQPTPFDDRGRLELMRDYELPTGEIRI